MSSTEKEKAVQALLACKKLDKYLLSKGIVQNANDPVCFSYHAEKNDYTINGIRVDPKKVSCQVRTFIPHNNRDNEFLQSLQ